MQTVRDGLTRRNGQVKRILKRLEEIAKEIRANADAFVLIGVGGSNNAARSVSGSLK